MVTKGNPLGLAEDRILVEQLRLSLGNYISTFFPVFLLAVLVFWTLCNERNLWFMVGWFTIVELSNMNCYRFARRYQASGIPPDKAHQMVWMLMAMHGLNGLMWGLLVWVALGTTTTGGSVLAISATAGIAGGAMATLSPVLPVFVAMVLCEVAAVASKLWMMGDPAYDALGVAGVLYIGAMISQGSHNSRASRAAIELRFENADLVQRLREKTEIAETARREAEYANVAKSKFLAAASHDLRQPIHAQGLFLEVLGGTTLDQQQQELLAYIRASTSASAEMLNTLLDFSRIEAGVIEPKRQIFALQDMFNKIEREFAAQADSKGLLYRSRETLQVVHSDPALVELILRNLVSNAIRYTDRGGVLVACRKRQGYALIEVWDTGIGIPASQRAEIFREFHQLGNPERDRRKGLGLGLAIVQGLARTLGHDLSLNSTPHRGSVFRLALPVANNSLTQVGSTLAVRNDLRGLRVLVIDDDDAVRASMCSLLNDWGCMTAAAENIKEALEYVRRQPPDVVISDYRLREQQNGVEAILSVRLLLGNHLPALLITGDTAPDRLREALASDIPVLHKPVSPEQLRSGLVQVIAKPH